MDNKERLVALKELREPFAEHLISKLPKPTKAQTQSVKNDFKNGIRCKVCGGWHHKDVIHLDYVGHAALTDRLLDVDPLWSWEPLSLDDKGMPIIDAHGGMWIRLTICGVTRLGYGDSGGKSGSDATKERIGDALRNAAMRFGCALDLWHKGSLHDQQEDTENQKEDITDKKADVADKKSENIDISDNDKKWVSAIRAGSHTLDSIEDAEYRKHIEEVMKCLKA